MIKKKKETLEEIMTLPTYSGMLSVLGISSLIQLENCESFLVCCLFYSPGLLLKHVPGFAYWTGGHLASKAYMDN
jgi:hypothetical protein